jgi:hypothetical protein
MTNPVSAQALYELIEASHPSAVAMALRNMFALGCLLVAQGHSKQGLKACNQVIATLSKNGRKTYLDQLFVVIADQPLQVAKQMLPSQELNELLIATEHSH